MSVIVTERPPEFDAKVMAHKRFMYSSAFRLNVPRQDCDDFVGDTIVACLRRWKTFKEGDNFFGWIFWQARGVRSSWIVKSESKKRKGIVVEGFESQMSATPNQFESVFLSRVVDVLRRHRHGEIVLRLASGETMQEIADETGITRQAVEQKKKQAMAYLLRVTGEVAA